MSVFGKIFRRAKKKPQEMTPHQSIQKLRETEEMLVKKQEYLEKKMETELQSARKHGMKNKRLALHALKRKRQLEKQLQQIDGILTTIEFQREALENASSNAQILQVMGSAAKALKTAHNGMNADQVHDLMEDIAEQQDEANEIAEAISNPVGIGQDVDDDDLLKELDQLEQEEVDKQLLKIGPTPNTPSKLPDLPNSGLADVPVSEAPTAYSSKSAKKTAKKGQDEDELAELEAWATG
ncbi:unnamed protein product [Toxocara canis]|uniref:Charged multivesicular body protein 4b n=1 Tax=Toxocara canis TaxID=6265 RepID=A0A183USM0_TOXCA|nr:unnamed protein product [Toxocara canis]